MTYFGFSGLNAEIVDNQKKGAGERTIAIVASGVTKRAAKRGAMLEAQPMIPLRDQDVDLIEKERSLGPFVSRYLFRITHNEDY